jgi:predicted PurR-regulated permease PerM
LGLLLVIAAVFWLLIPQIIKTVNSLIPNLSVFLSAAQQKVNAFLSDNPHLMGWIKNNTDISTVSWATMAEKALSMFGNSVSTIIAGTVTAIGGVFSTVFNCMIAVVFSVYCLSQKETLARQGKKLLYAFTKEKIADSVVRFMRLTNATFSNFLSGQCVEVCILGMLFAVTMTIFKMPYIPLISVVIALTAFIPIVGAWTGCIVGTFLIFVQDPMLAVLFVAMFCALQFIENNLIYPRVVGTSVGLSGMWVLVAVAIGGKLIGIIGMFLMIPVVSVLYTLLKEVTNKRLESTSVDPTKLQLQPPELMSKFKEKRIQNKEKKKLKIQLKKTKE